MAISFKNYVLITSGVGGGNAVRQRDLIGRIFTTNSLVPTKSIVEFTSADDVAAYFGSTSEEYKRSAFYFGWVSKNIVSPTKIAFARWADADTAPRIYGAKKAFSLAAFKLITSGGFKITLGSTLLTVSGLNFSSATSLSDIASAVQTAIRTGTGAVFTSATVAYDATRGSFNFTGGATGANTVTVAAATSGTDVSDMLGWLTGAILSNGVTVETVTDTLSQSTEVSNNFGSFLFIPSLTQDQIVEAATWNDTQNVMFHYCVPVSSANASSYYGALAGLSGVSVTLAGITGEYHEMVPMTILAATDYTKRNSVQNYMFQQFALTPTVTTTTVATTYDAERVNYYGRTQTAGQFLDFYQRGTMMGLATDAVDQNVYGNEIWLKDAMGASIMSLLLALSKVSANAQGRSQLLAVMHSVIDQALFNGTISVGKLLTTTQKLYIGQQTGDENAWYQVQTIGYWLDCVMQSYTTTDGRTEYKAVYTLIYSKDDCVRKVTGTHQLI